MKNAMVKYPSPAGVARRWKRYLPIAAMLLCALPAAVYFRHAEQARQICLTCGALRTGSITTLPLAKTAFSGSWREADTRLNRLLREKGVVAPHRHTWTRIALEGTVSGDEPVMESFLRNMHDYRGRGRATKWGAVALAPESGRLLALALKARSYPDRGWRDRKAFSAWCNRHEAAMERSLAHCKSVQETMGRVAGYAFAHPRRLPEHAWKRSVFYAGVTALWRATLDPVCLERLAGWAGKAGGSLPEPVLSADSHCCAQTYLDLYRVNGDPRLVGRFRGEVEKIMAGEPKGRVMWHWCDALFMSPPALVRLAAVTGEEKYTRFMSRMWWDAAGYLFDRQEGLFYRDADCFGKRAENGRKVFWSRGNGWVMAGAVRVLEHLPAGDRDRGRFIALLRAMARSVARLQGEDGLWRTSLLDPDQFPAPETSGSALFCHALAWGINHGVLEREEYLPVVARAWRGLVGAVNSDGRLGWVQREQREPGMVTEADSHEYGAGAFLLAGEQMLDLISAQPDSGGL